MKNDSSNASGRGLAEPSQEDIEKLALAKARAHSREVPDENDIKAAQAEILGPEASGEPAKP